MASYEELYAQLNDAQKQAVETVQGPVMVIAGPGTGKTQLLSMRVANILKTTDTLPANILCITFTESAALNMRNRLSSMIGQDAFQVAIHTFHSFGTELMSRYSEFFYNGALLSPADELTTHQILTEIFEKLPNRNPLSGRDYEGFTWLSPTRNMISLLKDAALSPEELREILNLNEDYVEEAELLLRDAFTTPRLSKKQLPIIVETLEKLRAIKLDPVPIPTFHPLGRLLAESLAEAILATDGKSTKPLTAWRDSWLEKNHRNEWAMKARKAHDRMRAVAHVYENYMEDLANRGLFDFDDMIMRVVHQLETNDEFRFNVQEQFQYILVDEFQDTNNAQARIIYAIGNNPVNENRPNIMIVGDDDQGIYRFQGADISNMVAFRDTYRDVVTITLTENYRSGDPILNASRALIVQGSDRLENQLPEIATKELIKKSNVEVSHVEQHVFKSTASQYDFIAKHIAASVHAGHEPREIAVLAPKHRYLESFARFLQNEHIPIWYERRENVFDSPHVHELLTMAKLVAALSEHDYHAADVLLTEVLGYPFWGIDPVALWRVAMHLQRENINQQVFWHEYLADCDDSYLCDIMHVFISLAALAKTTAAETVLDQLIGTEGVSVKGNQGGGIGRQSSLFDRDEDAASRFQSARLFYIPFRSYYFSDEKLSENPGEYLKLLSNLTAIRRELRNYQPDTSLTIHDVVTFAEGYKSAGLKLLDNNPHLEQLDAVQLMTAFKAKGLEFESVYILNCEDNVWGDTTRGYSRSLPLPHNLPLKRAGETHDDRLRLFYVSMTRAKANLYLMRSSQADDGQELQPLAFLFDSTLSDILGEPTIHSEEPTPRSLITNAEASWHDRYLDVPESSQRALLKERIENYQMPVTHLLNFIDVRNGGPKYFLMQNLLRFPQARNIPLSFGDAMHRTLEIQHVHYNQSGSLKDFALILKDFETILHRERLAPEVEDQLLERGRYALSKYFDARASSFTKKQVPEYSFRNQGVTLGDARLTGKLDLYEIKEGGEIVVTDYKTGKPLTSWFARSDEGDKRKIHNYQMQLAFYKLLVEGSSLAQKHHVNRGVLEFLEPTEDEEISVLDHTITREEIERLQKLILAVWRKITDLDWPDTSPYEPNLRGQIAFENDLIEGKI